MSRPLPLAGVTVLDFGHTVMGPAAGLVLGDLGADVIHIEPATGDPTRSLGGFGSGYFAFFNRNKRSVAIDLQTSEGRDVAYRLIEGADVVIENFGPGVMARLGLDYDTVSRKNPQLIYASLKGFLEGPYGERLALDEVVQMMSGLAFMTGPSGRPLRAGTSVVDIVGGLFAVIGIFAALRDREETNKGALVETALFESAVFLMGQHLSYASQVQGRVPPMPERVSAWAIYDLFDLADDQQIFVGVTSDSQWLRMLDAFESPKLNEFRLATNGERLRQRDRIKPLLADYLSGLTLAQATELLTKAKVPFSPVARPEDLFEDPHLSATGALLPTTFPNGTVGRLPRLPILLDHEHFGLRANPPHVGDSTRAVLGEAGLERSLIEELIEAGIIAADLAEARPYSPKGTGRA
jgi:crotonobetainyl-CoA:carnitine CoA-transferase CaiB-like acyl-CoA transferase